MLARILEGEYQLNTTGALCGANSSVSFITDMHDNNDAPEEPPALETDYLILFVGVGIAAAILLLVAVVKGKVITSIITHAGQRGAGQPKGE